MLFNKDSWKEIFDTIKKNKLRTFLSGFTVAIGILIFIILFGLGNGLENSFKTFFTDDKVNTIRLYPSSTTIPYRGYESQRRIKFTNKMLRKFYSTARKTFPHVYKPNVHYNLSYPDLFHHEVRNREGKVFQTNGSETFGVSTGKFTGRSPGDKWIVKDEFTEKNIWWGKVNQPISSEVFNNLYDTAVNHMNDLQECYIFDGYCGANKSTRRRVRFIHEQSWQQHFVKNMFIPKDNDDVNFEPDFTIINACSATNQKWREHGLNSEVAIGFNISREVGVILGTWYGGENKKGIFSLMNYWLPLENI